MQRRGFTVEDFVRIQSSQAPSFSSDGRSIAFRSNRSGVSQAYAVGLGGERQGPARQLTDTGGVIYEVSYRPGRDEVLYVADDGGDEQYQLHIVDTPTGVSRVVASAPGVINEFGSMSRDGRLVSFRSNRRERHFFDVWVADLGSGEQRCVLQSDDSNSAGRFSADGDRLLVNRPNLSQPGDGDLLLADLGNANPQPRVITGHDGVASWSHADFHASSGVVIAISDEGREFAGVQRVDPASHEREFLLEPPWDVEDLALSTDGSRMAVLINEDGYSRLEAYELTSEGRLGAAIATPSLPSGVASGLRWSPDARVLCFNFSGPRNLTDVWLADLPTGELRQLTQSDAGGIPVDALPEPELIRYKSFDGRMVPAFYYRQPSAGGSRLPCMVLVHGGPESQSRPSLWGFPAAAYLLSRGEIALLVPNVRGSTGYGKEYAHADDVEKRMDSVRDLNAAVDWLIGTGDIDPDRIGVMGGSYGGFMTLAAITEEPKRWAAAIDSFGIANFETFLDNTGAWRRRHRAREYGSDPAFLKTISPIFKADRIETPLMVIQGDHDVRVPPEESEQIVNTVRRNEGIVEYVVFEREGHGIQKLPNRLEMARRQAAFLREHLVGA
jgi:dipeptidyl aminopeptidase/acylaminoacyl peptidase